MRLKAKAGAVIETEVYVNKDRSEDSLLGEKDAERLGIVTVKPEGAATEVEIRRIKQNSKAGLEKEDQVVMRDQKKVDEGMEKLAKEYKEVFEGIGKYKGPPVEIQVKEGVRPVVQPPRRIPLHYQEPGVNISQNLWINHPGKVSLFGLVREEFHISIIHAFCRELHFE